jgi:hypothetical protein
VWFPIRCMENILCLYVFPYDKSDVTDREFMKRLDLDQTGSILNVVCLKLRGTNS